MSLEAQKIDTEMLAGLCDRIKQDIRNGHTDRETEIKALNLLRHISTWCRGFPTMISIELEE